MACLRRSNCRWGAAICKVRQCFLADRCVRIIQHPDVRRMLMLQKCFAEGMRALCLFTASIQDEVPLAGGHGNVAAGELDRRALAHAACW